MPARNATLAVAMLPALIAPNALPDLPSVAGWSSAGLCALLGVLLVESARLSATTRRSSA
jgi:hypothetical protein